MCLYSRSWTNTPISMPSVKLTNKTLWLFVDPLTSVIPFKQWAFLNIKHFFTFRCGSPQEYKALFRFDKQEKHYLDQKEQYHVTQIALSKGKVFNSYCCLHCHQEICFFCPATYISNHLPKSPSNTELLLLQLSSFQSWCLLHTLCPSPWTTNLLILHFLTEASKGLSHQQYWVQPQRCWSASYKVLQNLAGPL